MALNEEAIYDVVLLDAPCSGTGTFRKTQMLFGLKRKSDVIKNSKNKTTSCKSIKLC